MTELKTDEVLERIQEASKTYDQNSVVDLRGINIEVGQGWAQGDVQVMRVDEPTPDKLGKPWSTQQVVEGNTKGSRHVFDERCRLYAPADEATALEGPYAYIEDESRLLHPEHSHVIFPKGWYRVTYQRDFAREEIARVQD